MRRAVVLLAMIGLPGEALANGRPPSTNGVTFHPTDVHSIYVRSTFGLLVSKDDGCSFRWVCEKAIGYGGEFDPKYAVATDGTVFATTFEGLRVSRDGGCTWATATAEAAAGPGKISDIWIDALDIAADGTVWVATAESARPNDVFSSSDNGVTFAPRGQASATIWWKSVKTARSNPQRVYLTGYQVAGTLPDGGQAPPTAHLRRSDDGGATWIPLELFGERPDPPTIKFGATPIVLIAAVDPKTPDTLLLTSLGANGSQGDRLYRSTDAGFSFTEVLATTDAIRDTVFAQDGAVYVATPAGSFRSTDNGATFAPLAGSPQLACLGQLGDGKLVGCGANWEPDFKAVAVSSDSTTWSKQFRFVELAGPLQCDAGTTVATACDPLWPSLQQQFGATGPNTCGVLPDTTLPEPPAKEPGGCCDASHSGVPITAFVFAAGWLALLRRRRRCCD
ncbi:MAG: hypothetical protein H0V17_14110 [Deltaproteobacteria bacterium]|nr:hypothetical protein [Deltaproteobacteria bacterium]